MRTPASRRSSLARLLACSLLAVSGAGSKATGGDLYGTSLNAASGGNPRPSLLYSIDAATGAGTLIGSVGHAINGLAFDPTTGVLYGSTPSWDATAPNQLLAIDLLTGAGTPVGGPFGVPFVSNLTFNDAGELYAFAHHGDELVRVDKTNGLATIFREEFVGDGANLLAFDNDDVLMLLIDTDLWAVDTTSATITLAHDLTVDPGHHGGFDPGTGLLWSVFTLGFVQDSVISHTNVVTDEINLLDTDVQYLHTLAFREGGGPGLVSFTLKSATVAGCKSVSGTVTLGAPAPPGGLVVTITDTLAAANPPASVLVAAGALTKKFTVKTTALVNAQSGQVSATLGATTIARDLTVRPMAVSSVSLNPTSVTGGTTVPGSVKLECKAAPGSILVELSSTDPEVALPTQPSLVIPAGSQSAAIQVTTTPVASRMRPKIVAEANGGSKSRTLTVNP